MRYLLDTCILLWALEGNKRKLGHFAHLIEDPKNEVGISVVSYWEISIKKSLGKLHLPKDWMEKVELSGFFWFNLEPKHIHQLEKLPLIHNDPFDRLLIAQAQAEQYELLTLDEKILLYKQQFSLEKGYKNPLEGARKIR